MPGRIAYLTATDEETNSFSHSLAASGKAAPSVPSQHRADLHRRARRLSRHQGKTRPGDAVSRH
jgi:hypothetical protein